MAAMTITKENFQAEVMESQVPVLLDFWAPWCGPCKMVLPMVEEIAGEITAVKVGKINTDEQPELAEQYKVMTIPTLIVIKDGQVVENKVFPKSKPEIMQMIQAYL